MKLKNIIFSLVLVCFFACSSKDIHQGKTPIAKVYDKYLYYEDLGELIAPGTSKEDSIVKVITYINVWAKKELMIKKAEIYLTDEQKDVEKKIEDYRNSLIINAYQEKWLEQKLDIEISRQEKEEYFNEHIDDFKLQANVVKCFMVQIGRSSAEVEDLKKLLSPNRNEDSIKIMDFCKKVAYKFDYFGSDWVTLSRVSDFLPDRISEKSPSLKKGALYEQNDDNFIYFVKIFDHLPQGQVSPYSLVEKNIESLIKYKRKTQSINELEQNLYDNALQNGNFEIFKQ